MKHFKPDEFACGCGCGTGYQKMDPDFLRLLERARTLAGTPFRLNSAYRCKAHNRAVGGVPGSSHTKGLAVDIAADNTRIRFLVLVSLLLAEMEDLGALDPTGAEIVMELLREKSRFRAGIGGRFIHFDRDPEKTAGLVWTY